MSWIHEIMTEYEALEVAHNCLMDKLVHLQTVYANNPDSVGYELGQTKGAAKLIADRLRALEYAGSHQEVSGD